MTKICSKCKHDKPVSDFHRSSRSKHGVNSVCKMCVSERDRNSRLKRSADAIQARNDQLREYRKSPEARKKSASLRRAKPASYSMFYSAKLRASRKKLDFDLMRSDIQIPELCPILGVKLKKGDSGIATDHSPTLDRIDSSKGYTKSNIWVISWRANRIKNDASLEELRLIVSALERVGGDGS